MYKTHRSKKCTFPREKPRFGVTCGGASLRAEKLSRTGVRIPPGGCGQLQGPPLAIFQHVIHRLVHGEL